jgi:hypothetical protein|nr:hypothetical protein [Mediterranea sp. An20]
MDWTMVYAVSGSQGNRPATGMVYAGSGLRSGQKEIGTTRNDRDMSNYDFIKIGNKVFWHDPDGGLSDGVYQVVDVPEEIEEDSIILIASDYSEAEVFAAELSPL